ncbi:ATP-grasp domain-containing protein [Aureimonas populi]|uniref:RimK family alpha-L-glutamate ligase n=1 Tax=Aureimonas populi TaxID=1701758 RepID=A0ABW5CN71_9HYPH|nr:hypothetical protein [Aureimonas populi]
MILIAGGQYDTNLTALVDRLKVRGIPFHGLLVGPEKPPRLRIDIQEHTFELDGKFLFPSAFFIRQDVFLYPTEDTAAAHAQAFNWYHAIRGWAESRLDARMFNRRTTLRENNKIHNLIAAHEAGLRIPRTIATNDFAPFGADTARLIQKPVAGGEYTGLLEDFLKTERASALGPRFIQPRLGRPEFRVYRIGPQLMAFSLQSPELDYRQTRDVTIAAVPVPAGIAEGLTALCDRLDLDFAAADFMLDDQNEPTFLEVNSQPMFAAFDRAAGGRLCDAILDCLMDDASGKGSRIEGPSKSRPSHGRRPASPL